MAHESLQYQADRVAPTTPDLIATFRMEDEVIDALRRIYRLSKAPGQTHAAGGRFKQGVLTAAPHVANLDRQTATRDNMILQNMRMLIVKIFNLVLTGFSFLSLTACSRPEPPPLPEVARPAKLFTVVGPNELMMRSFPAKYRASGESNLAFRVSGKLVEFPANRGIEVHQGDLLARLDHSDYQAAVNEAQA